MAREKFLQTFEPSYGKEIKIFLIGSDCTKQMEMVWRNAAEQKEKYSSNWKTDKPKYYDISIICAFYGIYLG